jgi:hypothetical protein
MRDMSLAPQLGVYQASFLPHSDIIAKSPAIPVLFENISMGYFFRKSGSLFGGLGFEMNYSRKYPTLCFHKSYTGEKGLEAWEAGRLGGWEAWKLGSWEGERVGGGEGGERSKVKGQRRKEKKFTAEIAESAEKRLKLKGNWPPQRNRLRIPQGRQTHYKNA